MDGDVPLILSYSIYSSQLFPFARICNTCSGTNGSNLVVMATHLHQGHRIHKYLKDFTNVYYNYKDLVYK